MKPAYEELESAIKELLLHTGKMEKDFQMISEIVRGSYSPHPALGDALSKIFTLASPRLIEESLSTCANDILKRMQHEQ